MLNNSQDIQTLLAGPKFPDKEFIRSGATLGEVYAMAAGLRTTLAAPEYQGTAICLAVDDRAVMAAILLAALHPSLERAALGPPCPAASLHPSLASGPTLLLPFALSGKLGKIRDAPYIFKLFQQVVKKEMADDTFQPRDRSLARQSFGWVTSR